MRAYLTTAAAVFAALATATNAHAHAHHEHKAVSSGRALGAHFLLRGLEADNSTSTTDYTCPICGMSTMDMGYDDHNYVELTNGQRVYTCGMDAYTHDDYSFAVTDTSYLAANMAEFVTSTSSCDNSCDECADGIADPVSGATISADSFEFVCLTHGQKIYFASAATKAAYLGNVTSEVRYLVEDVICSSATCSDATEITKLSTAASSADLTSAASSASGSSATAGSVGSSSGSSGALSVRQSAVFTVALAGAAAVANALSC